MSAPLSPATARAGMVCRDMRDDEVFRLRASASLPGRWWVDLWEPRSLAWLDYGRMVGLSDLRPLSPSEVDALTRGEG